MSDGDVIVCFELPCHAQQSRSYKKQPDDPFVLPVFLCDPSSSRTSFARGPSLFGYPFILAIDRQQSTNVDALYDALVERLQRWTANATDLFTWEARPLKETETTSMNNVVEIKENGAGIIHEDGIEEGDIADEKSVMLNPPTDVSPEEQPCKIGPKKGIFNLRLQSHQKEYGTANGYGSFTQRFVSWELRKDDVSPSVLLRENDALFCEFDENMKAYYFGDERSRWEHARWDSWEQFNHPEYEESRKASAEKKNKGVSLQDCLEEFTKVCVTKWTKLHY